MFPTGTNQVRIREHDLTEGSFAKLSEMSKRVYEQGPKSK